jgi:hypothetical protein
MTTTPTSGAADLPEALRRSTAADGKTELFNLPGYPLMVRAVDFNRIHAESEMRRTALLDEMQKAALAAGQATAAQQGAAYAALPEKYYLAGGEVPTWDAKQMRAFADAVHTLRASHGQAPADAKALAEADRRAARAPADSVQEDAARYRWLRDGEWRDTDLEPFIRLQLNMLWDAKIDAARAAQEARHD